MGEVNRPQSSSAVLDWDGKQKSPDISTEKHYSIQELASLWNLSEKTIRKLFENEPGTIEIGNVEGRFKRAYKTRRIPESVAQRVHRRLRKPA
jgi:hypothetical protein